MGPFLAQEIRVAENPRFYSPARDAPWSELKTVYLPSRHWQGPFGDVPVVRSKTFK
jgi:hypothetical protein